MLSFFGRNSRAPLDKAFEEYHGILFGKLSVWGSTMGLCVQWFSPAEATTSRSNPLSSPRALANMWVTCSRPKEKVASVSVEVAMAYKKGFLFGTKKSHF